MVETKRGRDAPSRRLRHWLNISPKLALDHKIIALVGTCAAVALGVVFDSPVPSPGLKTLDNPAPAFKGVGPPLEAFKGVGPRLEKSADVVLLADGAAKLRAFFSSIGYRLERVRAGDQPVPRVFVASLPSDMPRLGSVATRKAIFIKTMLPLILRVNEEILLERRRLIHLKERIRSGRQLSDDESLWLERMAVRAGVTEGELEELLHRIDVIPPSLALAQAAEESGWGTSRFTREGNAPFGERTYRGAPGIVPRNRPNGQRHKIKSFDWLLEAVRSYARNLNFHPAYDEFRRTRAALRGRAGEGAGVNGRRLADTLVRYSERGAHYVRALKIIMGANDLHQFDKARLSAAAAPRRFVSGI